jgi:hypothetical protein
MAWVVIVGLVADRLSRMSSAGPKWGLVDDWVVARGRFARGRKLAELGFLEPGLIPLGFYLSSDC